jgi:hypothetical protein
VADFVGEVLADAGGVEVVCAAGGGGAELLCAACGEEADAACAAGAAAGFAGFGVFDDGLLATVGRTPDTLFTCMALRLHSRNVMTLIGLSANL